MAEYLICGQGSGSEEGTCGSGTLGWSSGQSGCGDDMADSWGGHA